MPLTSALRCWCGNGDLHPYAPGYAQCDRCGSLVAAAPEGSDRVSSEESSLYGLNYFNEHAREMGHPTLQDRVHLDLGERCAFWLETLLRFRAPPARTLELGCASGAFVGLLAEAGYDATGLDLSPAVTAFAQESFQVPMLTGRLEEQHLPPGSLDVVAMMDVLEHLPDPVGTLREVASVLSPQGLLLVQTPRLDPTRSFEQLSAAGDPFLAQLKPREHLFLLSPDSARTLVAEAGLPAAQFVPAIFAHYDMCFVASREPPRTIPEHEWRAALRHTRSGRVVEALLDSGAQAREGIPLRQRLAGLDAELAELQRRVAETEQARDDGVKTLAQLRRRLDEMASELARQPRS